MQTQCSAASFGFQAVEGRSVVASFDGGTLSSDAGALLLGETDRAVALIDRFAACFTAWSWAGRRRRAGTGSPTTARRSRSCR